MAQPSVRLTLYLRSYCHLCLDFLERLRRWPGSQGWHIDIHDIDDDPEMAARYNDLIPLLTDGDGNEICRFFFDDVALTAYLAKIR